MRRREFIKSGAILCLSSMPMTLIGCSPKLNQQDTTPSYPSKPIKFIVPYSAGSTSDMIARLMEKFAIKYLGQPFITTNVPGGGSMLGMNEIAGAKPDGYTIGIVTVTALLQPNYGQTRYNYFTALEPLIQVTNSAMALMVLAETPWENLGDLINYAKTYPGKIKYGHAGLGTVGHVVGETFAKVADINIAQVPFQGDSDSLAALLGGHVQVLLAYFTSASEYVKAGKVRVLAVATKDGLNVPGIVNVPSFKAHGLDIEISTWHGVVSPKMLPSKEKVTLADGLSAIVNDSEFKMNMEKLDFIVEYLPSDAYKKKWCNESEQLKKIVEDTGIAAKIAAEKG